RMCVKPRRSAPWRGLREHRAGADGHASILRAGHQPEGAQGGRSQEALGHCVGACLQLAALSLQPVTNRRALFHRNEVITDEETLDWQLGVYLQPEGADQRLPPGSAQVAAPW